MSDQSCGFALVVTADDFGIGLATSKGIIQAHLRGPVTATSMMVITADHARASVGLLAEAPNLDVGLHIVLTACGHAPLTAGRSSGLVDRAGDFLSNARLWLAALSGKLNKAAVAEEIAAQAQLFRQLVGRAPTHVDAHHHAHQLPTIRQALVEVIGRGILPPITRTTIEAPGMLARVSSVRSKRLAAHSLGKRAARALSNRGIWSNDFFFGMLGARDLRREFAWQEYLELLPRRGAVEWVVHPGLEDPTLAGRDGYRAQRVVELEGLVGEAGRKFWEPLAGKLGRKSVLGRNAGD
jgi:predicted glycoside hydrolase/deacetylase ChbG (UPF0249 family)